MRKVDRAVVVIKFVPRNTAKRTSIEFVPQRARAVHFPNFVPVALMTVLPFLSVSLIKLPLHDGGTPNWVKGKYGYGMQFDGINDYLNFGSTTGTPLDINISDFTLDLWLKLPSNANSIGTFIMGYAGSGQAQG